MELANVCGFPKYFAQIQRYTTSENTMFLYKDFLEVLTQHIVLRLCMVFVCVCVFDVTKYLPFVSAGQEKRIIKEPRCIFR